MKHRSWMALVAMIAAVVPLTGASAADATGCRVTTYTAIESDGYYMYGAKELWEESNGLPGLQRSSSYCIGKSSIPEDTCIVHAETWRAVSCAVAYGDATAP